MVSPIRISIITPVYNGKAHIAACIENVRAQRVDGLEHIVVDGASRDGTPSILADLARQYPHLRFVSEKDNGQSDAMNRGVRMASAELIGILNVDDFYEPNAVADAVSFLEHNKAVDFVAGDCNVRDENNVVLFRNAPRDLRIESLLLGWDYAQHPVNPSAYFYRKRIHDVVGEYKITEHYGMDIDFIYSCAAKVSTAYRPRLWGNFCELPGSKTVLNRQDAPTLMRRLRYEHFLKLPLAARFRFAIAWFKWKLESKYRGKTKHKAG